MIWAGVAAVLTAGYLLECWIWPYAKCRRCTGNGKHPSPLTQSWRSCRKCGGSGRRIRIGRALLGSSPPRP